MVSNLPEVGSLGLKARLVLITMPLSKASFFALRRRTICQGDKPALHVNPMRAVLEIGARPAVVRESQALPCRVLGRGLYNQNAKSHQLPVKHSRRLRQQR